MAQPVIKKKPKKVNSPCRRIYVLGDSVKVLSMNLNGTVQHPPGFQG